MQIKIKNMWLRYLACAGVVVGLLFLIATSCDNIVNPTEDFSDDPNSGLTECEKAGFEFQLANDKHANAFEVGKFTRDAVTGAHTADVTVKLSGLTHENDFVSNHAWLHPNKVNPLAYIDEGVYTYNQDVDKDTFPLRNLNVNTNSLANGLLDRKWCQGSPNDDVGHSSKTTPNRRVGSTAWTNVREIGISSQSANVSCRDTDVGGVFIKIDGTVQGMQVFVAGDGSNQAQYVPGSVQVEAGSHAAVAKTGVYYLRDNTSPEYMKLNPTAPGDAEMNNDNGKMYHENGSDALYDEFVTVFKDGGASPANLKKVFSANINGIATFFPAPSNYLPITKGISLKATMPMAKDLGTPHGGGWQKLFTIKPCDETKFENGFILANEVPTLSLPTWKSDPNFAFRFEELSADTAGTFLRQGTNTGYNDHMLLIDTVLGGGFTESADTSFFTIRHTDQNDALSTDLNAVTTKGEMMCRSAIGLPDVVDASQLLDRSVAIDNKATALTDKKITGYVDGDSNDDKKGVGMTCYLGLTALWPEAVAAAPKLAAIHDAQFNDGNKKEVDQFDVSDKNVGIVLMDIDPDVSINNDFLKYIFIDTNSSNTIGTVGELSARKSQTVLKAIKDAESDDVNYMHGVMTLKFTK